MKYIPTGVSRVVGKTLLQTQKHSPTLLFVGGVVGMVGATVLACRATLKVEEVLDKAQIEFEKIDVAVTSPLVSEESYNLRDARRDKAILYIQTSVQIGKLYAPAILVGVISVAALTRSHQILTSRNAALTAAYSALMKSMDEYRDRVAAKFGREAEEEIYRDLTPCEIEDPEKPGKTKIVQKAKNGGSIYSRFFDRSSTEWQTTPEYNLVFLRLQQRYWNDRLRAKGHVFLNEVYDTLGIPRSPEASVVGWLYKGDGDGYIDFADRIDLEHFYDYANGNEGGVWLDFNVDGVIYDKI